MSKDQTRRRKAREAEEKTKREEESRQITQNLRKDIFNEELPINHRFWCLKTCITAQEISDLKSIPYRDFLQTIYWDIVRKYKLHKAGYRCELCGARERLNVHHKTYEYRGEEYNHLDCLIVLCQECHQKFHDKLSDRKKEESTWKSEAIISR